MRGQKEADLSVIPQMNQWRIDVACFAHELIDILPPDVTTAIDGHNNTLGGGVRSKERRAMSEVCSFKVT